MSEYPTVTYYGDNRIEDLTREELIEALKFASHEIHRMHEDRQRDFRMREMFSKYRERK